MDNKEKLLKLNQPGFEVEFSSEEAEELGAFEETALSEEDAREATEDSDNG